MLTGQQLILDTEQTETKIDDLQFKSDFKLCVFVFIHLNWLILSLLLYFAGKYPFLETAAIQESELASERFRGDDPTASRHPPSLT